jgi:pimeloyl-ACP methyl ester carboxylesterase
MGEQLVAVGDVSLCVEPFGVPSDPAILLLAGYASSMLWWEDGFCGRLADGGRFVIRYDQRDTGRSIAYPVGAPQYGMDDLVADAVGVLDALGVAAAHVVGVSMGGAIAQLLALDHGERVRSLVLMMTSPSGPGLPPPSAALTEVLAAPAPSDPEAVVGYVVEVCRAYAGDARFDAAHARALVQRDVARSPEAPAAVNHGLIAGGRAWRSELGSLGAPTLVIQATEDPLFAAAHGEALAAEIPGAKLLRLEGAGHILQPADWETVVPAILDHTS